MGGTKANIQITAFTEVPGTYAVFLGMQVEETD